AELMIGGICLVPYAPPGSASLAEQIVFCGGNSDVYLLENHGAVAVGKTTEEALHRMERAEFLAKVMLLAEKIGGGIPLSKAQLQQLQQQGR
ncbi:class II aldolase/adducin family protein, partial [bacterium]|nr:class II aldolase/adducin family protein [bacterium]